MTRSKISQYNRFLTLLCLGCLVSGWLMTEPATAHPHIWIDRRIEVQFDENGLAGFHMHWVFDEMTSSGFIVDYDTDRNNALSKEEIRVMKKEAFEYLKNYGYMTHITINGKPFQVKFVTDFNPVIKQDQLIYRFFIPCHVRSHKHFKEVAVGVYDEEYYVDFAQKKGSVKLVDSDGFHTSTRFRVNKNKSFYFNQFHPTEFILRFKNR